MRELLEGNIDRQRLAALQRDQRQPVGTRLVVVVHLRGAEEE